MKNFRMTPMLLAFMLMCGCSLQREEEDAPVPLTDIQISQIRAIEEQLHDLKGKLDALEKEIQDDDKSCAVSDALAAIEDALDSLGEALGNPRAPG